MHCTEADMTLVAFESRAAFDMSLQAHCGFAKKCSRKRA
jgi:hypothetical protein